MDPMSTVLFLDDRKHNIFLSKNSCEYIIARKGYIKLIEAYFCVFEMTNIWPRIEEASLNGVAVRMK